MLKIKGIGPKKVQFFWVNMGLQSLGELHYACSENRLAQEKGFGVKTQAQIQAAIEYLQSNRGKFHYGKIYPFAEQLLANLQADFPDLRFGFTGALRRKCEVIETLEFITDAPAEQQQAVVYHFRKHFNFLDETLTPEVFSFKDSDKGIAISCRFSSQYVADLFRTTASESHLKQLNLDGFLILEKNNEEDIYAALQMDYILPELREGLGEIELAKAGKLPSLIEMADIRGVVHAHSTYSDGADTLKNMAAACQQLGYGYLVISDHSKSAFYANGLSEGRIEEQQREIDKLNQSMSGFRIFKGIESDILRDGSLDYEESVLKTFDCVIASVHSILSMDEANATQRLLRAIENPYTRILGHPTGRLLLSRTGYPLDHKRIIDACAANRVAIELNANPYRLDLDWRWIAYAMEKGVLISINPDAHSIEGIGDIRWGVAAARKGMLTKSMCLNAKNAEEFEEWLGAK